MKLHHRADPHRASPAPAPDMTPGVYVERARADLLHPSSGSQHHHHPPPPPQQHHHHGLLNPPFSEPLDSPHPSLFQGQPAAQAPQAQQTHPHHMLSAYSSQPQHHLSRMHAASASAHDAAPRAAVPFGARHPGAQAAASTTASSLLHEQHQPPPQTHEQAAHHASQPQQHHAHSQPQGAASHGATQQQPQTSPPPQHHAHAAPGERGYGSQQLSGKYDDAQGQLGVKFDRAMHLPQHQPAGMRHYGSLAAHPHALPGARGGASSALQGLAGRAHDGEGMGFVPPLFDVAHGGPLGALGDADAPHNHLGGGGAIPGVASMGEHMPGGAAGGAGVLGMHAGGHLGGIGEFAGDSPLRRFAVTARRPRARARLNQLSEKEKKERHNAHTRSSRLRIDEGLQKLKGALRKARPNLKLNKKADIVDEAVKYVLDTYANAQVNHPGAEQQDSSLSG